MKTILLTRDLEAKCWMSAELINGTPSPDLIKYFGTHKIPTTFTTEAFGVDVYRRIQDLNPEAKVIIIVE